MNTDLLSLTLASPARTFSEVTDPPRVSLDCLSLTPRFSEVPDPPPWSHPLLGERDRVRANRNIKKAQPLPPLLLWRRGLGRGGQAIKAKRTRPKNVRII